jgi:elongation factor Ts
MGIDVSAIKKLRETTSASVSDIRFALEEAKGDEKKALEIIKKKGMERAAKKTEREVKSGKVFSYVHHTGKIGVMLALGCETDFVAKTDEFEHLGREMAMHIAAAQPENTEELLKQEYIRDASKTVQELMKETIGKLGENIQVLEFRMVKI